MATASTALRSVRKRERGKRLVVAGVVMAFYASLLAGTIAGKVGMAVGALLVVSGVVSGVALAVVRDRAKTGTAAVAGGVDATPPAPAPLCLVREHGSGCGRWIVAGPFALLGSIASLLQLYLVVLTWMDPSPVPFVGLGLALFVNTAALLGLRGLFYRAGLVLDARRGVFFTWWGIGWPWFRRYEALAALHGVGLGREKEREGWQYVLELQLDAGRALRLEWPDARNRFLDLAEIARSIASYAGLGEPHGLSAPMDPPRIEVG